MKELLRNWLTEDERRYLAMHARHESERQTDVRYWNRDPVERERLRLRWREIADELHGEPRGSGRPLGDRIADAVAKATSAPGVAVVVES